MADPDIIPITVRLPAWLHERLRERAFRDRVSIASLIIAALSAAEQERDQ